MIPGFISLKAYELFYPGPEKKSSEQIIDAVAYSCLNYALLFWLIILVNNSSLEQTYPFFYVLFCLFVLFLAPILWVIIWRFIRTREVFLKSAPHPTQKPWDYVFSKCKPYWIKITLKDGTKVAGRYGSNSFALSAPAEEQIFLEESWIVNEKGGLERPKKRTAGIIVMSSEIAYLELIEFFEKGENNHG